MNAEQFLNEANGYEQQLVEKRRYLHRHAETGFDLHDTLEFVKAELKSIGYDPQDCGKAGAVVTAGGKKPGKVFLIRGDMDALPIHEEADVDFPSETGKMHACGHDMHTTMMLGAAKLLKEHEDEIEGTVKLMFQPSEETFEGAHDMIKGGVLKNPDVDAALMIHVMAGQPFPAGTVIVSDGGISAPGADYFNIHIQGKGCHGSMPNAGVDPVTIAASFRRTAEVSFDRGCPVLKNDGDLSVCAAKYVKELLGQGKAFTQGQLLAMAGEGKASKAAGSEDFAYVSQEVPSIMLALAAGHPDLGYAYPQHHPKVKFDESVLAPGSAVYAYTAMRWLEEHK